MQIQRIVKMTFKPEYCGEFERFFESIHRLIESQPGCKGVKLLRDQSQSGVYFTYSNWDNEAYLNTYRTTDLFNKVWPKVKEWFAEKPEAWSTELLAG